MVAGHRHGRTLTLRMAIRRTKAKKPVRARSPREKIVALLCFIIAAGAFYYLTNLPAAVDLKTIGKVEAGVAEDLVLHGLDPPNRLLSYQGAPGETVDLRFDRARLHPETIVALNALGFKPPADEGEIAWITRHGRNSQTAIDVRVHAREAASPNQIHILPVGTPGRPRLRVRTDDSELEVEMAVPLGDSRADANSEKQLVVRDFSIKSLPGSFAIKVIVSAKGSLDMQFGANLSGSAFVPGALDDGSAHGPGLLITAVGVRQRQADAPYDIWACAAARGAVSWDLRGGGQGNCRAPSGAIRVTRFELGADRAALALAGSAFIVKDGEPVTDDWYSKLENNKLFAALLALFYAALARWVWKTFTGAKGDD